MIHATIVSTKDCHLCERARSVLHEVAGDRLSLSEVDWDSPEGQTLVRSEGIPFPPAVFVDGRFAAYGRVSKQALAKFVAASR